MNWNQERLLKSISSLLALGLGLVLTSAASASPGGTDQVAAGLEVENQNVRWEKFLIKGQPQPTFRFAVGHQHTTNACYGYLYVSRNEIWYEVKAPIADRTHEFRYPFATLTEARQWKLLGSAKPAAELKFSQGKTYHVFRIPESLLEDPDLEHHKLNADDMLSWQPIVQAAEDFDETVRMAEHGHAALAEQRHATQAPRPAPMVTQKLEPGAADNVSQPPPAVDKVTQPTPAVNNVSQPPPAVDKVTQPTPAVNNVSQPPPPTIVLVEPSVEKSGQTLEVTNSALTVRGVAVDNAGIPAVTINGIPATVHPRSGNTAELSSAPIVLQSGENRFEVSASDSSHAEAKVVFIAHYTPPPPSEKAQQPVQPIARALTKADIIRLLKDKVPSAQVTAAVRENGIRFMPTERDLKEIRAAGGRNDLVHALREAAPPLKP
ncbi:MAG: hypothetical protein ACYDA9_04890 [Terriglobia bacterium]